MNDDEMMTQFDSFNQYVNLLFNDRETSLQEKIERIANFYIDMMIEHPEVASVVLSQAKEDPDRLVAKMKRVHDVNNSVLADQILEMTRSKGKDIHAQHFVMNIISMCVFPLLAGNMIKKYGKLDDATYNKMMQERKALIPVWAMAMINN